MSFTRILKNLRVTLPAHARSFYSVQTAHEYEHHLEAMSNSLATHSNTGSFSISLNSSNHFVEEISHHGRLFVRAKHHSDSFATACASSHEVSAADHPPVNKFEAW